MSGAWLAEHRRRLAARRTTGPTRRSGATAPLMPSCDLLLRGEPRVRAKHVAALQRLVGNRRVSRLLEPVRREQAIGPSSTPATAVADGSIGGLHGRTESTPDCGKRSIAK